jgi:nicotinamide phosphoribosyltransferase
MLTKTRISDIPTVLLKDGYKVGHVFQYPPDTTMVYSNFTPRKGRPEVPGDGIIFFGLQYFIKEYLIDQFVRNFFHPPLDQVLKAYKRRMDSYLGPDSVTLEHIEHLYRYQYLPLRIKALPEGSFVPYGVPVLTIQNTEPDCFWLTNMLETLMSNVLWMGSTSATTAFEFRKVFTQYAKQTVGDDLSFVPWQGHDFSFRGMPGVEAALISGAAHLTSFTGTDTIPAIDFLETYYGADSDHELVGGSVPATEHSVMSMGLQDGEDETFRRLLQDVYPDAPVLSVVSDTWDFWNVVRPGDGIVARHKDLILSRPGKLVIRPDSGDPYRIVCGYEADEQCPYGHDNPEYKGAIQCLWETFGGVETERGYKLLDPHIGLIYGDSITLDLQKKILAGLEAKGFSSYNVVFGVGSYTYQHVTRDTHGFAMKATAGATESKGFQEIFKDPKTDNGTKKSARGLLMVDKQNNVFSLLDRVTPEVEETGYLEKVFEDGTLMRFQDLQDIRDRVSLQVRLQV